MAFAFFRKRQKLIFLIMVLLMVSFLIGFQGFSMLFSTDPEEVEIGQSRFGKISNGMIQQARSDLDLLSLMLGALGRGSEQVQAYQQLRTGGTDEMTGALGYALLLRQAGEEGFMPIEGEVNALIQRFVDNGLDYEGLARNLRQNRGLPETALRGVLARWLTVYSAYRAQSVLVPPSEQQLAKLYRDFNERMAVEAVRVPASAFLEEVGEPTDEQVREMFQTYRNRLGGEFAGINRFDFGYLRPARVDLAYLFVDFDAIRRGTVPTTEQMRTYYDEHRTELTRDVPLTPQPDEAGQAPVARKEPMSFAEARPRIIEKLQPELAQSAFVGIVESLQRRTEERQLTRKRDESAAIRPTGEDLRAVLQEMTLPADELLGRTIPLIAERQAPLEQVVRAIARQANPPLNTICFPYDTPGEVTVSPDVKVTLMAKGITVGEALAKVAEQIPDLPTLSWAAFDGMESVLFPISGIRLFPATFGRTDLVTQQELRDNPLLGSAFQRTPRGPRPLASLAFSASPIQPDSPIKPGVLGPKLLVWTEGRSGQLLWQLLNAVEPKSPDALSEELRTAIVRDWKIQQAFEWASKKAAEIETPGQMQAFVEKHKLEPIETGLFSRKMALMGRLQPGRVGKMGFRDPSVDLYFIEEAMDKLPPSDLDGDYPKESGHILSLPLESEQAVVLARRIDYEPALQSAFREELPTLLVYLSREQYAMLLMDWFNPEKIRQRAEFTFAQSEPTVEQQPEPSEAP
jgi:hypothetical protein